MFLVYFGFFAVFFIMGNLGRTEKSLRPAYIIGSPFVGYVFLSELATIASGTVIFWIGITMVLGFVTGYLISHAVVLSQTTTTKN